MSKLLTIKWMQLLMHIWRNRETNGKQQLDNITRIGSMVTHFQLPPYEFHWATRPARDTAISANSLGTWFFSKEKLRGRTQRLQEIIPYRTEYRAVQRGWLPTCVCNPRTPPPLPHWSQPERRVGTLEYRPGSPCLIWVMIVYMVWVKRFNAANGIESGSQCKKGYHYSRPQPGCH